ncbi:HNH endonuclease signature motif containing protein [Streptomyces thermolilacinus]|uniref:HNH endonuclease signature motif containing protein n=1 Tax=Streptomyces thermolilacinus TaxID=285540 RepID=UPI0033EBFFFC
MAQDRPDIPTALKRAVLVEAGHRCAIPTCRQTPVELAHITPWAKVKAHTFDNLIALCPTCHTRFDRGEIDRKAVLQYKANLEVLNHRYTDIERQLLKAFVKNWQRVRSYYPSACIGDVGRFAGFGALRVYADMWWTLANLLDDGIIEFRQEDHVEMRLQEERRNARVVLLTEKGRKFLAHWIAAQPI